VTEIFLAYDSSDRERVRPVRDTLTAQGFDVHWDLEPPAGAEWERWVLRRLARCKCVLVLRSGASVLSNRMSHVEAMAKEHGKLIVVRSRSAAPNNCTARSACRSAMHSATSSRLAGRSRRFPSTR